MSVRTLKTMVCDRCGAELTTDLSTQMEARSYAMDECGWTHPGWQTDLCEVCTGLGIQ